MAHGASLPLRAASAFRLAARSTHRVATQPPSSARFLPAQCQAARIARPPCSCPSPPAALFASRSFSTSLRRHKDKDAKPPPDPLDHETHADDAEGATKQPKPRDRADELEGDKSAPKPAPPRTGASGRGSAGGGHGTGTGGGDGGGKRRKGPEPAIVKPAIPDVCPRVMAVPLVQRPLFPGFYKAITIRDREVGQAIAEMMKRGQPYIGAFLFKDDSVDKDVIHDRSEVYDVGTFCQVTSAFPVSNISDDNYAMTCVLYPHRRIRMTGLTAPTAPVTEDAPAAADNAAPADGTPQTKGDVVASFEEPGDEAKSSPQDILPTLLKGRNVSIADVENMVEVPFNLKTNKTMQLLCAEIISTFKSLALISNHFRDHVATFSVHTTLNLGDDPVKLADLGAAVARADSQELQDALEQMDIEQRLNKTLEVLKKELISAEMQKKLSDDFNLRLSKKYREHLLMEQMKGIKRELGMESDGKDKLIEKFTEKAGKLAMPEAVRKVFEEEMSKLQGLEPSGSEFNVTRNYIDWLTQLPWGLRSAENFEISHARKVLDEDHHGLDDVKKRILEFIAVGKLSGTIEGKILCLVGPPGVGKTSIGKSIARALNRQYYRFSVGGMYDVAEIKGHRRTYVGALPGRIVQALKKCQTENPLVLIDEVDKIGRNSNHGDPASALLELLDPEQNNSFLDHYLDVPIDLSKVLFVCTANMDETIPAPLLDRMEVIRLSGYVSDEKIAIADKYLSPAAKGMSGLKDADVVLHGDAIVELIHKYCRESGVRNLKKHIEKVYRKAALKIVTDLGEEALPESAALTEEGKVAQTASDKDTSNVEDTPGDIEKQTTETPRVGLKVPDTVHVSITKDNLQDYVGPPIFTTDRLYDFTPLGVAMGLAWTSMGGSALYIECILQNALSASSTPGLERTGSLRDVMKESTHVAYSFAKSMVAREFPKNKFFEHARIHMHCPEGATPKDGPSAGITMATSLLSLALDKKIRNNIAMTGELTLTGKVLRIGGLREKTVAAKRAGAQTVVFPKDNMHDWDELPENIKEGMEGRPVQWYKDVFDIVFADVDKDTSNKLWDKELKPKKGDRKKREQKRKEEEEEESGEEDD